MDDETFQAIHALINKYHPEDLLALGAPEDEYDAEVTDLLGSIHRDQAITSAAVADVFSRWFGKSA